MFTEMFKFLKDCDIDALIHETCTMQNSSILLQ